MKKILFSLLSFVIVSANAQTTDEIIQKYAANMGGLEAITKVKTAKITGTALMQGNELPVTIQIINGKAMRTDLEAAGKAVNTVYNNGTGWRINPFTGATTATEIKGAELVNLKLQASLANNLMDYKSRGHQVELMGQEDIEGIKTFKIKLTSKDDGKIATYFINTADYLLVKTIINRNLQGKDVDVETYYSDIKEINGLKFSMNFVQKIDGVILQEVKYEKIELNVPVDEKIFEMPK